MLVGEIRDQESASIAVAASLTGHLLFASLHTNTACQAVTRLLDMGLQDYQVMTSLKGVLAQRLMRQLCPNCKVEKEVHFEELPETFREYGERISIFEPKGCEACAGIGFRGRVPVFELLEINSAMRRLRGAELNAQKLEELASQDGFQHLSRSATQRVVDGDTSLSEYYNLIGKGR